MAGELLAEGQHARREAEALTAAAEEEPESSALDPRLGPLQSMLNHLQMAKDVGTTRKQLPLLGEGQRAPPRHYKDRPDHDCRKRVRGG